MFRKIEQKFIEWRQNPNKKALLVTGARQIGKTYLARRFGKSHYEKFVEINFLTQPSAAEIFKGDLNADTLIMNLTAFLNTSLERGKTLVFFDEIQECPNARTAIKFLVDDGRFDYIESGSLLGVNYKHVPSYPVGYEETLQMYPMDFEEFCMANGVQRETIDVLRDCYNRKKPPAEIIHKKMTDLFRYYVVVGGMPAVVQTFVDTHDIGRVVELQKDILAQYRQDISQYTLEKKAKVTQIFDEIPAQLDDKNRRFTLAAIDKNSRLREYEDAFVWLQNAGVALPCYNLSEPKVPLKINEQSRLFKLFMGDTGLLCAMGLENVQFDILQGNLAVNMGGVLENVFAQQLKANGFMLRYLNKKSIGEVDFVIQQGSKVVPIEIKSGKDYKKHAALDKALAVEEWGLEKGMVFCSGNVEEDERTLYLPWYMVMFFKQADFGGVKVSVDVDF